MKNKKHLGQHWLKNREILEEIAELAYGGDPEELLDAPTAKKSLCLEIGPGLGTLTSSLLKRFEKIIAVEYDKDLAENLPKSFPGKNLEVVNADFLNCDLEDLPRPYIVAGNIPYYITSPIIDHLLNTNNRPERIVLLIQKEVAERIAAKEGRHTVLSLTAQARSKVTLGPVVKSAEFTPPPKVDSQVIILEPYSAPKISDYTVKLIKHGFKNPRKKLIKNLGPDYAEKLKRLNIPETARPAELSLEQWKKLAEK